MKKLIFLIIGIIILGYIGYKYFDLDKNQGFQNAVKAKNYQSAFTIARNVVFNTAEKKAVAYFNEHNGYFISQTNNVCNIAKSFFAGIQDISSSPVECSAKDHTFTARLKATITKSYYCADSDGLHTTDLNEPGFQEGVKCK